MTIDEHNPQVLYAGSDRIFKSEDGGVSWTPLADIVARSMIIDAGNPNVLYAANVRGGVYKSTDGGQTWEPRNQGLTNTNINHFAIAPDTGRIYAATGGAGVWFSDDGAESWE